jgi:hypothetical protein
MSSEILSAITFLAGMLIAMIGTCVAVARASQMQQEILKRGTPAQGTVLRVWRPPVAGSFARVYFEFQPAGVDRIVRCCHVDRRTPDLVASLPAVGASVAVRYLPERPAAAVIAKLVSRFGPR